MSITFTHSNPNSWSAIAARVAERQHSISVDNEPIFLGNHDFADTPFTQAEARAEVLKWFWQH
jgi:hypothetical protein